MCNEDIVSAKKLMAFEVTKLVHGEEEAIKAKNVAKELFENKTASENMPTENIKFNSKEINILDFLNATSIISSKAEARRLIEQGGITINSEKKFNASEQINLSTKEFIVKKAKKHL